jgi:DNA-binding LacI/PurR family transcriptional regulator
VPADVSVVGWDNIAIGQYLAPALSSIAADPFHDGRVAATCLLDAIDGVAFDADVRVPDPVFVPRKSTAPAPRHSGS